VDRDLDWPACVNIRDLGGLATASGGVTTFGVLIRADNVHLLTASGWAQARAYGVRTILDLRSEEERGDDAPVPSGLEVAAVSLFHDFDSDPAYRADLACRVAGCDAAEANRLLYTEALERNAGMFATALHAVAEARQGAVLMHCTAGKNRTGLLAALLLGLVGVPTAAIAEDYEWSEHQLGITDRAAWRH
jgi:protein-tyrosine phosphatase